MSRFVLTCPATGLPCIMGCSPAFCSDKETERILGMSKKEVMAEHLANYDGNKKLADKAIDIMRAKIEAVLAKHWKQ